MSKKKSFQNFFYQNKQHLPYYFKDFKSLNLTIDDTKKIILIKNFRSDHLKGMVRLERFYKPIVRLD